MKQTIVIKISMNGPKSRTKAMKIAVGLAGVEKAEIQGQDKNQIAVTGDGIDSTELTMLIRKKVGHTELVSVTPIAEKKEEKKSEAAPHIPIVWTTPYQFSVPSEYYHHHEDIHHPNTNDNDSCTIM